MYRIWGFDPQQGPPGIQAMLERIHPEDHERFRELFERGFEGHLTVDVATDHRIVLPDGTKKYVHATSHPVFDQAGQVEDHVRRVTDVIAHPAVGDARADVPSRGGDRTREDPAGPAPRKCAGAAAA